MIEYIYADYWETEGGYLKIYVTTPHANDPLCEEKDCAGHKKLVATYKEWQGVKFKEY